MIPFIIAGAVGFGIAKLLEKDTKKFAGGGSVKGIKKKAENLLEESISYRWVNTDMGSGWSFELESPLDRSVFNILEHHTYLDEFSPDDMGIEDYDDLSKEEQDYYYEDWKEELFQSTFEAFKEKCKKHLDDFIEYIQQAKEYQDEMNEYAGGGETFMAGGMTNKDILRSFLTSERETQTNNLATFYSTLGGVMLLRNYGTLIAKRNGRRVEITNVKHSKTTSAITNRLKALAEEMGYNVSYVSEFEEGGEAGEKSIKKPIRKKPIRKKPQPKMVRQYFEDRPYSYAKGGSITKGYNVFNYTDNLYANDEVFKTKKLANDFIKEFRNRYSKQGYYRDSQMNKIDIKDIDLLAIPSNFNPFKKGI